MYLYLIKLIASCSIFEILPPKLSFDCDDDDSDDGHDNVDAA